MSSVPKAYTHDDDDTRERKAFHDRLDAARGQAAARRGQMNEDHATVMKDNARDLVASVPAPVPPLGGGIARRVRR